MGTLTLSPPFPRLSPDPPPDLPAPDPETYTVREAREALGGVDRKTLLAWCVKEGFRPVPDAALDVGGTRTLAYDGRHKRLTREQVERLARRHGRTLRPLDHSPTSHPVARAQMPVVAPRRGAEAPGSPGMHDATDDALATLSARLATLERTVRLLTARWEAEPAPTRPVARPFAPTAPRPPSDAPSLQSPLSLPRPALPATHLPLPEGHLAYSSWCALHGVQPRTGDRLIAQGVLPQPLIPPEGHWWRHTIYNGRQWRHYDMRRVYSPEQHARACLVARHKWPEQYRPCGPQCPVPLGT